MSMDKVAEVKARIAAGDLDGALRIASRIRLTGAAGAAIHRGWEAHRRPEMYRQMGQDPAALITAAHTELRKQFGGTL